MATWSNCTDTSSSARFEVVLRVLENGRLKCDRGPMTGRAASLGWASDDNTPHWLAVWRFFVGAVWARKPSETVTLTALLLLEAAKIPTSPSEHRPIDRNFPSISTASSSFPLCFC
jgi:hypothetical protein